MRAYFRHTSSPSSPSCALTHAPIVIAIWIRDAIIRFRTRVSCKRELSERCRARFDEGRSDPWNRNWGEESWKKIEGGRYGIRIRGAGLRGKGGG